MDANNLNIIEKAGYISLGAVGGAFGAAYKLCAPKIRVWTMNETIEEATGKAIKTADNIKSGFAQVGAFTAPFAVGMLVETLTGRVFSKGSGDKCNNPCEKKNS